MSEAESNAWFEASDRKARSNIVWSTLYTSLGENPARWEALFELYDNRRNHSLTYEDFRELLQACGIEMDDLQFEEICRDVDTDGDRLIEVQEFFAYVKAQPVTLPTSAPHANEPEVAPPNKSVPPSSLLDMIFCIFPKFSEGPRSEELELCSNSTAQQGEGDVELGRNLPSLSLRLKADKARSRRWRTMSTTISSRTQILSSFAHRGL